MLYIYIYCSAHKYMHKLVNLASNWTGAWFCQKKWNILKNGLYYSEVCNKAHLFCSAVFLFSLHLISCSKINQVYKDDKFNAKSIVQINFDPIHTTQSMWSYTITQHKPGW